MDQPTPKPVPRPRTRFVDRLFGPLGSVLLHAFILIAAVFASTGFVKYRASSSGREGVSGSFAVGVRGPDFETTLPPKSDAPCPKIEPVEDVVEPDPARDLVDLPTADRGLVEKRPRPEVAYEKLLPTGGDGREIRFGAPGTGLGAKGDGLGDGKAEEVYNPAPVYPPKAKRQGVEGEVLVEVAVTLQGTCAGASVVQGSGSALLDDAAIAAVKKWEFRPATRGGVAVPSTERIRFVFRLDKN